MSNGLKLSRQGDVGGAYGHDEVSSVSVQVEIFFDQLIIYAEGRRVFYLFTLFL
jgi:hypothetical protein